MDQTGYSSGMHISSRPSGEHPANASPTATPTPATTTAVSRCILASLRLLTLLGTRMASEVLGAHEYAYSGCDRSRRAVGKNPELIDAPQSPRAGTPGLLYGDPMLITPPPGDYHAYLFDCDGTVADSMPLHYTAWEQALGEWGCELPEDLFYAWGGRPVVDIIASLNDEHGLTMSIAQVARRREELFQRMLPQLRAVPETLEHIEEAHRRIPFAIVSGSTRASVTASLSTIGLLDRFDTLVCAGDYDRPKPAPEGFLRAASLLDVAPEHCLVFEDTDMGIQAATAAGMKSVRIPQRRMNPLSCAVVRCTWSPRSSVTTRTSPAR